jgi:hypothetical protein
MRHSSTLYAGLDVHQEAIAVASVAKDHDAEVIDRGPSGTRQADLDHLVLPLQAKAPHLVLGSDAGLGGDGLSRDLTKKDQVCWVVAPALMPHKAGDRVHTARRDAGRRARLMRAGDRPRVEVPAGVDDANRDWKHPPHPSRKAAGRPNAGVANATDASWPGGRLPSKSWWPVPGRWWGACGPWPSRVRSPRQSKRPRTSARHLPQGSPVDEQRGSPGVGPSSTA